MPSIAGEWGRGWGHICTAIADDWGLRSSLNMPRIIAASTVHYGTGHPLNRTEVIYPDSEGYMPAGSSVSPRMSIITRRSLLRGLLQALVSVKDIYRVGRASTCLHICTSSRYLDLVWNEWLPDWDQNGWPSKQDEEELMATSDAGGKRGRRSSSVSFQQGKGNDLYSRRESMSNASVAESNASIKTGMTGMTAMTGDAHLIYDDDSNRLVNEDLLRKVAIYRRNFFSNEQSNNKGAAYVRLIHYRQNPADKLAKESAQAAALDMTTQLPRHRARTSSNFSNGSVFSSSVDSRRRSQASLLSAPKSPNGLRNGNGYGSASPASMSASLPLAAPVVVKRPSNRNRMPSKDVISEHGAETDVEEFNDAASTLSDEAVAPSTLAKVMALPAAVVGAGVAVVMASGVGNGVKEETAKDQVATVPAPSGGKSFEKEATEALAAVRPSSTYVAEMPKRVASITTKSTGPSVPAREASADIRREPSARSMKADVKAVEPAREANADMRREPSARSTRPDVKSMQPAGEPVREHAKALASMASPEKPAAKQRSSFFSLRKRSKEPSSALPPAPLKPATDRLIDYRPPQSRNLRTVRSDEDKAVSAINKPFDEVPSMSQAQAPASTRSRPFSFFRKRTSVREVF